MFSRLFGKPTRLTRLDDQLWISREQKLRGLCRQALAAASDPAGPQGCLLVAHFPDTLAALEQALIAAGIPYDVYQDAFDRARLSALLGPAGAGRPLLALARSLPDAAPGGQLVTERTVGAMGSGARLLLLAAERHPLRAHDDKLEALAAALPAQARIGFHLSLEDGLMQRFGGQAVAQLISALNPPPDEPITSGTASASIRRAQQNLARHARGDAYARSAEEWLAVNVGESA